VKITNTLLLQTLENIKTIKCREEDFTQLQKCDSKRWVAGCNSISPFLIDIVSVMI